MMNIAPDIEVAVNRMRREGNAFALATVIRTLSVTAAKPGAKAIIDEQGNVIEGWIGGGCARSAVCKAARASIEDGQPRVVSLHPSEVLEEQGLEPGPDTEKGWVATNMCPSRGSMEIFVEPHLANPELVLVGASPVASSLSELAPLFHFRLVLMGDALAMPSIGSSVQRYAEWAELDREHLHRYIVIATQGAGDYDALLAALAVQSRRISFVGSRRKLAHLSDKLEKNGLAAASRAHIKGPAGLDIGAVSPHEIALSILAELIQLRRQNPVAA